MYKDRHWFQFLFKRIYFVHYYNSILSLLISNYQVQHSAQLFFSILCAKKEIGQRVFMFKAPADWNNLAVDIRSISLLGMFKHSLTPDFEKVSSCHDLLLKLSGIACASSHLSTVQTTFASYTALRHHWASSLCKILSRSICLGSDKMDHNESSITFSTCWRGCGLFFFQLISNPSQDRCQDRAM